MSASAPCHPAGGRRGAGREGRRVHSPCIVPAGELVAMAVGSVHVRKGSNRASQVDGPAPCRRLRRRVERDGLRALSNSTPYTMDMNNTNGKHQLYANTNSNRSGAALFASPAPARYALGRPAASGHAKALRSAAAASALAATGLSPAPRDHRAARSPRPALCWVWPSTATGALMRAPMRWPAALAATGLSPTPAAISFPQE